MLNRVPPPFDKGINLVAYYFFAGKSKSWGRFDFHRIATLTDTVSKRVRAYVGYYIFAKGLGLVEYTFKQKDDITGARVKIMRLRNLSDKSN